MDDLTRFLLSLNRPFPVKDYVDIPNAVRPSYSGVKKIVIPIRVRTAELFV